jgi:DNA repair exonuclease SbcCD ATPase subunit
MITMEDKNTENVQEISKDGNKVRSIRADSDTYEKFKKLSEEFDGQGRCLAELIHMYEINQARNVLIERQVEIDDFQTHIEKLRETYLYSLRLNADAEDRIREAFKVQLNSKDETILSLQETNKKLNADLEIKSSLLSTTLSENREHTSKNSKLEKEIERTSEEYNKKIKEKDDLNAVLMSERQGKEARIQEMEKELADLRGELVNLEVLREEVKIKDKELSDKETEYRNELMKQKESHQEELKKAWNEYKHLMNSDREKFSKELEMKNEDLREMKEELKDNRKKMRAKEDEIEGIMKEYGEKIQKLTEKLNRQNLE